MSIVFCEFSLFVNIKYLHNIRDNKLNQAFLIYFFYTEKLTCRQNFMEFSAKIQWIGPWSMANPSTNFQFMKIGAILFEVS